MSYGEQTDAEWLEMIREWAERNAETVTNARTVRRVLQMWDVENAALRTRAEQAELELEQVAVLLEPIKEKADASAQKLAEALPRLEAFLTERAALRARAEQAERERDEAKEVFEVGLRSSAGWAKDLSAAYAERDALRAEAAELLKAARWLVHEAGWRGPYYAGSDVPAVLKRPEALGPWEITAPLSAAAVEQWEAMERVVEAAHLKRNTSVVADKTFEGEWIAVPLEDFKTLRERVDALDTSEKEEK